MTDKEYLLQHLQYMIETASNDKQISTDCIDNLLPCIERYNQNEAVVKITEDRVYSFDSYKQRIKDGLSY